VNRPARAEMINLLYLPATGHGSLMRLKLW